MTNAFSYDPDVEWSKQDIEEHYSLPKGTLDDYEIIYSRSWSDNEEFGGLIYFRDPAGDIFELRPGYYVMSIDNTPFWNPWKVWEEYALEKMIEFNTMLEEAPDVPGP
jgi:hypothetical protein